MIKSYRILFILSLSFIFSFAQENKVLLTVSNNNNKTISFTQKDLLKFKRVTFKQTTFWTKGLIKFSGFKIKDLLDSLSFQGKYLTATAYNDYKVTIPISDFYKYEVIIADSLDDKILTVRSKGPLWIIYNWGNNEKLKNELYYSRSIWQLVNLKIHD